MKLISSLSLAAVIAVASFGSLDAQAAKTANIPIDIQAIETSVITDPEAYRDLVLRYEQTDPTITDADMATAYYGFAFSPLYDPDADYSAVTSLMVNGNFGDAYKAAVDALVTDPFSLQLITDAYVSATKANPTAYRDDILRLRLRSDKIVSTILRSGRGVDSSSPFIVINDADIHAILRYMIGVDRIIGTSKIGNVDAYKFTLPGDSRQHILYFVNIADLQ